MHLNQMRYHHVERTSRLPVAKRWSIATILVVGLAGLIHLSLIREHFAEQFVYGLIFLRVRGARATCISGDPRGEGASCDVGEEKEQGDAALVPGNHSGRRMI